MPTNLMTLQVPENLKKGLISRILSLVLRKRVEKILGMDKKISSLCSSSIEIQYHYQFVFPYSIM